MGSSTRLLAFGEDADDAISGFCDQTGIPAPDVIRDIARIACIANLVRNGTLDGEQQVLCGGMAMRCLASPRLSIYDADTASREQPRFEVLREAIEYADDDITISARDAERHPGRDLVTARPIVYNADFTTLDPGQAEFSLSVASRGLLRPGVWKRFETGYPFPVLADPDMRVPIMAPVEMLAEKIVAWWLFGHAKHYHDIHYLRRLLKALANVGHADDERSLLTGLVDRKLGINRNVGVESAQRVDALTPAVRRLRLEHPDEWVDPGRSFAALRFTRSQPPGMTTMVDAVRADVLPLLD